VIQGAGFVAGSGQGMGGRRRCDGNGEEKEVEGGGRRMTGGAQLSFEKNRSPIYSACWSGSSYFGE